MDGAVARVVAKGVEQKTCARRELRIMGGKDTGLCGETRPLLLPKYYQYNKYFYNRTATKLSKKSIESM